MGKKPKECCRRLKAQSEKELFPDKAKNIFPSRGISATKGGRNLVEQAGNAGRTKL